jgi:hypothetical protein
MIGEKSAMSDDCAELKMKALGMKGVDLPHAPAPPPRIAGQFSSEGFWGRHDAAERTGQFSRDLPHKLAKNRETVVGNAGGLSGN